MPGGFRSIEVKTATGSYPVLVGRGLLEELPDLVGRYAPAFRYALIADDRVAALYGGGVEAALAKTGREVTLFTFPNGERSKHRKQWSILTDAMLDAGFGRDSAVIALGGGVTGDLAGFVAATYMRGIPVVQVPTSVVAMVDASVGGKTGVDVRAGKNLVGAFHPPRAVVVDPDSVRTLERAERAQGFAEAVKHGAILDGAYFGALTESADALMGGDAEAAERAVLRSVELKARVVGDDEREHGMRQILNFGHTIGHALEAASAFELGHGTAVATGMVLEARIGEAVGITERGTSDRLVEALRRFDFDPESVPRGPGLLPYIGADKKTREGRPRFVLLQRIGVCASRGGWAHEVDRDVLSDVVVNS